MDKDMSLFKEIIKRIDENIIEIKKQTEKTNGKVHRLEIWKAKVLGALIVMNILFIPVIIIVFKNYLTN